MFKLVGIITYSLTFVSLLFLIFGVNSFSNWLLFFSMLFFLFGVFEIFESLNIHRRLSFKSLGSEKLLVIAGTFPSFLSVYYLLNYGNLSYVLRELIFGFGVLMVFLVSFLFFLFTFKGRRSKRRIFIFFVLSGALSWIFTSQLGGNVFLLYSIISILFLTSFLITSFSKFSIWNVDRFFVLIILILVSILGLIFIVLGENVLVSYALLVVSVVLILVVFSVLFRKFYMVLVFGILWGGGIAISTVLLKDILPSWVLQANVLSIISIFVALFVYWYFDNYRISFSDLMKDIDTFLKKLHNAVPREFENYNKFVVKVFNSHSRFIKISILPQNVLPNFILSKMLKKKSLSINEVFDSDTETKNFFISNKIMWISRISNEISETDYLIVKFPRLVSNIYFRDVFDDLVKNLLPIFLEIDKMISNLLIYPMRQEIESKREYQVREVESFDKVRYFLIKSSDVFLYGDKVIAYKYVEDINKMRGYYFDFVAREDSFLGFLFFIPDRLFLSNFVLLAIKGIIKSYSVEDISFEKLKEISKDFVKEREFPLQISITGLSIVEDGIIVYPSNFTFTYTFVDNIWREVKNSEKFERNSVLLISNKPLGEEVFSLVNKIPKDNKFDFVREWFDKVKVYEDEFLLICV